MFESKLLITQQTRLVGVAWAGVLFFLTVAVGAEGWKTNYEEAAKQAKEEGKDLLLEFTGSDWCPPCKKLTEAITGRDEFFTSISEKYVLVKFDFPRNTPQDDELKKANRRLANKYKVRGYPTILICDAEGRVYGKTGFSEMSIQDYIDHIVKMQEQKVSKDEAFAKASTLEGEEKAAALYEGLKALDAEIAFIYYGDTIDEIKELDPSLEIDIKKPMSQMEKMTALLNAMGGWRSVLGDVMPLLSERNPESAVQAQKVIDDYLADNVVDDTGSQTLLLMKSQALVLQKKTQEALDVMDQAYEIDPDSAIAKKIELSKKEVEQLNSPDQ